MISHWRLAGSKGDMNIISPQISPIADIPVVEDSSVGFYPWYVISILMLIYTSSFVDRTIISLLVGPIRADLHITDTQMSFVSGNFVRGVLHRCWAFRSGVSPIAIAAGRSSWLA